MKYESKPRSRVEVEAFQWDGEIGHAPDWFREGNMGPECCMQARRGGWSLTIYMDPVEVGDWIVRHAKMNVQRYSNVAFGSQFLPVKRQDDTNGTDATTNHVDG